MYEHDAEKKQTNKTKKKNRERERFVSGCVLRSMFFSKIFFSFNKKRHKNSCYSYCYIIVVDWVKDCLKKEFETE